MGIPCLPGVSWTGVLRAAPSPRCGGREDVQGAREEGGPGIPGWWTEALAGCRDPREGSQVRSANAPEDMLQAEPPGDLEGTQATK